MRHPPALSPGVRIGSRVRPAEAGRSLFDYADDLRVQMPASCRRTGRCHECVVEILQGADQLTPATSSESFLRPPHRLACQALIQRADGLIEVRPLRRRLRILTSPEEDPLLPDLELRRVDGRVEREGRPVDADRGMLLGLAIDVGTTTVVVELVDLESGRVLGVGALENPQRFGGSDVMHRISYEAQAPGELRRALLRALNAEIRALCASIGADRRTIQEAVVVGNSTMRDLFFGLDPAPIGVRPYKSLTELEMLAGRRADTTLHEPAHRVGLWMHPRGLVYGPPLIASHVGSDVAADLVAIDIEHAGPAMLIDIGTNTEVVVSDGRRLLAASCPAGPAFEGGLVRFGMAGADGAIERARLAPDGWHLATIGDAPAEGICGSGLIDLLAELRVHGLMGPMGAFHDRSSEVVVEPTRGITLSREDASNLAQAKAANACGQAILLRHLGIRPQQLQRVYLAGGFANHIDVDNAIAIGFLAPVLPERVVKVGNASIRGARRLLLSRKLRASLGRLVRRVEHIELETTPDFFELFVEGCQFKPLLAG